RESLDGLRAGNHGIVTMPEWNEIGHFFTRLAAPARDVSFEHLPRNSTRTMGRVALLATRATEEAIADAGLTPAELHSPELTLAYGSTHGSSSANEAWVRKLLTRNAFLGLASTAYLKFMSNTTSVNLAIHFGLRGRVLSTCAACVSASQAIGYAYEHVAYGLADVAIAGGAEELHFTHVGVFDTMHATSRGFNDQPDCSPRPFDQRRDGLVVGEGAGTFVLEEYERAKASGKRIYGEILGYGTNCDGEHATSPSAEGMRDAMERALRDAKVDPAAIGYVNAHATATTVGDIAESHATHELFGDRVPVSSMKGNMGHTLGGCGAIETGLALGAMLEGWIPPTKNLELVDEKCAPLDYVQHAPRESSFDTLMTNKFAFGGINASLVVRRV
ncbi:MAG: beta-ketoacyl-ACP synthase, partial [Proteobacteria bacterium]